MAWAEFLLHNLAQATESIGIYVNSNETNLCFNEEGSI